MLLIADPYSEVSIMNDWETIDPTTWYCSWPNCMEQATHQEVLVDGAGSIRGFLADTVIHSCNEHMRQDLDDG